MMIKYTERFAEVKKAYVDVIPIAHELCDYVQTSWEIGTTRVLNQETVFSVKQ